VTFLLNDSDAAKLRGERLDRPCNYVIGDVTIQRGRAKSIATEALAGFTHVPDVWKRVLLSSDK